MDIQSGTSVEGATSTVESSGTRQGLVDRLRGFALLGVLVTNTPILITSVGSMSDASMPGLLDRLAGFLTGALFQAKSYVIFAFLVGYSFTLFLDSLKRRGVPSTRPFLQRLAGLCLLGLFHAVFAFPGDILLTYGVLGLLLLLFQQLSNRALVWMAGIGFLVQCLVMSVIALLSAVFLMDESMAEDPWTRDMDQTFSDGGVGAVLVARCWLFIIVQPVGILLQGCMLATLFAVGVVAGRNGWLQEPATSSGLWRRLRTWGLGIGLPLHMGAALVEVPQGTQSLGVFVLVFAFQMVTGPILSLGLVGLLAGMSDQWLSRALESAGRLSLTCYLGGSLVMSLLAAPYGLGLFGMHTGPAFALALCVWAGWVLFARFWNARFGQGPAERVLRFFTWIGVSRNPGPS